jgi:hypothetical protein
MTMTYKEKEELYLELYPFKVFFDGIRALLLIVISLFAGVAAILAAFEGEWNKGIFFLIAVVIIDNSIDRLIKSRERRIEAIYENIGD